MTVRQSVLALIIANTAFGQPRESAAFHRHHDCVRDKPNERRSWYSIDFQRRAAG
jgi:hypothetical protein